MERHRPWAVERCAQVQLPGLAAWQRGSAVELGRCAMQRRPPARLAWREGGRRRRRRRPESVERCAREPEGPGSTAPWTCRAVLVAPCARARPAGAAMRKGLAAAVAPCAARLRVRTRHRQPAARSRGWWPTLLAVVGVRRERRLLGVEAVRRGWHGAVARCASWARRPAWMAARRDLIPGSGQRATLCAWAAVQTSPVAPPAPCAQVARARRDPRVLVLHARRRSLRRRLSLRFQRWWWVRLRPWSSLRQRRVLALLPPRSAWPWRLCVLDVLLVLPARLLLRSA